MKDVWAKAKANQEILHFKNFQTPEITWGDALEFVYDLSSQEADEHFVKRAEKAVGSHRFGTIIFNHGYFLFEERNLFKYFKGVEELMAKVNGGNSGKDCEYYTEQNGCGCEEQWHIQTLRMSIGYHDVSNHNDPCDVLYWQVLGNSRWVMNNDKEYLLEPGDLLYFNQEDAHMVFQDGPRAGIIIDGPKK